MVYGGGILIMVYGSGIAYGGDVWWCMVVAFSGGVWWCMVVVYNGI